MTNLLIVESPAKCSKIQGFLGSRWKVIATMGHIRALEASIDAIGIDRNFDARYEFVKEKAKAIAQLKECAKQASAVYLAADDDREGEAIAYSVAVLLKLDVKTTPRVIFREITKTAIMNAVQSPGKLNMDRVNAQQARAILDMMVGFTISPLLWKFVGQGLSAGRCQTPALRLVVEKERSIQDFKAESFWAIQGIWSAPTGTFDATMLDVVEDEESAKNYLENVHEDTTAVVTSTEIRSTTESAPKPLITSTLQQEASALYQSQPKNTMKIAQRLYEQGYITYMRTDHPVLSEEAHEAATAYVRTKYGEQFIGPHVKAKASQDAQEAHEAIRPTDMEMTDLPVQEDWSAVDRKLYRLIWNRTIQSVMAPSKGEVQDVKFRIVEDPGEFPWLATWKRITFQGWKRVSQALANLDEEEDAEAPTGSWTIGASLEEGDTIHWVKLATTPKETRAPTRFTEATLVRELERKGIGRPSTFASLIDTLLEKKYVDKRDVVAKEIHITSYHVNGVNQWPPTITTTPKRIGAEKNKLTPTALGLSALEFCLKEFPHLFAYTFTRDMEEQLDEISQGGREWRSVCQATWDAYRDKYEMMKQATGTQTASARQHVFSNGIKAVQSKKGPLLLIEGATKDDTKFYGWPTGVSFASITEDVATAHVDALRRREENSQLGDYEGEPMLRKKGPYGEYVTCGKTLVPFVLNDTPEMIREKIRLKRDSVLHRLGPFEFRRGPYGIFMFKTDAPKKQFVNVPSTINPVVLTEEAAVKIFQTGLQIKNFKKRMNIE
jgi:DNA topoisomerase-1